MSGKTARHPAADEADASHSFVAPGNHASGPGPKTRRFGGCIARATRPAQTRELRLLSGITAIWPSMILFRGSFCVFFLFQAGYWRSRPGVCCVGPTAPTR